MATEVILTEVNAQLDAFLNSDDTFAGYGFQGNALSIGFTGKLEKVEARLIEGPGVTDRTDNQVLNLKTGAITVQNKGNKSVVPSLVFEGGARTIAISTLTRHPESNLKLADGTIVAFKDMTGKQWKKLVADKAQLTCTDALEDPKHTQMRQKRNAPQGELESRPIRKYSFVVEAPAV